MKKFLLILLVNTSLLIACNNDESLLVNSESPVLSLIQERLKYINVPDISESYQLDLPMKIENKNEIDGTILLQVNLEEVGDYELLPQSCYTITNSQIDIAGGIEKISPSISILPKKIADIGGYRNQKYILPIKVSSDVFEIDVNDNTYQFIFEIDSLIFEENFNSDNRTPDPSIWTLCSRGTSDWNRYVSESYDQAYLQNGNLVLKTEKINGEYLTGAIESRDKFYFQYGKVSVKAKFTKIVQGGWSAIWMLPQEPVYSGGWPYGGEIDIMEHLNKWDYVHHAIHTSYTQFDKGNHSHEGVSDKYDLAEYNLYELEWGPEEIVFLVNGNEEYHYENYNYINDEVEKQWPFDAPFYMILNNSLGGEGTWPGVINDDELPGIVEIDWVRISQ